VPSSKAILYVVMQLEKIWCADVVEDNRESIAQIWIAVLTQACVRTLPIIAIHPEKYMSCV
jgi:hypothetical protein